MYTEKVFDFDLEEHILLGEKTIDLLDVYITLNFCLIACKCFHILSS